MNTEEIDGNPENILSALRKPGTKTRTVSPTHESYYAATFEARIGETVIYKVAKDLCDVEKVMKTFVAMIRMEVKDIKLPSSKL